MTGRSTRNKMRHQAEKIINDLDRALSHCKILDEIAEDQSEFVNEYLSDVVKLLNYMQDIVKKFRSEM